MMEYAGRRRCCAEYAEYNERDGRAIIDLSIAVILVGLLLMPGYRVWLLLSRWYHLQVQHRRIILPERSAATDVGGAAPDGIARHPDEIHGEAGLWRTAERSLIDADVRPLIGGETNSRRAAAEAGKDRKRADLGAPGGKAPAGNTSRVDA